MTDIPKGYKQTEVGVIPEDWEVHVPNLAKQIDGASSDFVSNIIHRRAVLMMIRIDD